MVADQNTAEMVEFVLNHSRPKAGRAEPTPAPMRIVSAHLDTLRTYHSDLNLRQTEAAFHHAFRFTCVVNFGIGEANPPAFNGADEHLSFNSDLRAGQPDASVDLQEGEHLLNQIAKRAVEAVHRLTDRAQDGIGVTDEAETGRPVLSGNVALRDLDLFGGKAYRCFHGTDSVFACACLRAFSDLP